MKIQKIISRMILDSRGYPTTEVDIILSDGSFGRASTPSGASTGFHEALELRDGGSSFGGKNVSSALFNINTILAPILYKEDFLSQRTFDEVLIHADGSENKSTLGANALLPLSLAFAKATAMSKNKKLFEYIRSEYFWSKEMSLPTPLINVLNGGRHALHSTDVQEWMIVPLSQNNFKDSLEMCARVFYELRTIMGTRGSNAVGDEGGFPLVEAKGNKEALDILMQAVNNAKLIPGKDIGFALDVAASEFYEEGVYNLKCDDKKMSSHELTDFIQNLTKEYPIISIEDGLAEDDIEGWQKMTEKLGTDFQIVGDDLFVTNTKRIAMGIEKKLGNAVLIKPNQIGTLSETADAILLAQKNNYNTIISHRSGETEDTTIAHLAVASGAGQIKTGSLSRTERIAKYNELLRISETVQIFKKIN